MSLREDFRTAVAVGFGPGCRFSAGRLRRGVADNGLFLEVAGRGGPDLPVPETDFTFGQLITDQAGGGCQVLIARGRRTGVGEDPVVGVRASPDLAGSGA